jgi:hypothetical protein
VRGWSSAGDSGATSPPSQRELYHGS